jgi:hypothetical protein
VRSLFAIRSSPFADYQLSLALPLFVLGILADHAYDAVTANHLAFVANLLNGCPYLHDDLASLPTRPWHLAFGIQQKS